MIQDIYPYKLHNEYLPRSPRTGDYLFAFAGSQAVVKTDETFFRFEDLAYYSSYTFLFEINSTGFFLIDEPEEKPEETPVIDIEERLARAINESKVDQSEEPDKPAEEENHEAE